MAQMTKESPSWKYSCKLDITMQNTFPSITFFLVSRRSDVFPNSYIFMYFVFNVRILKGDDSNLRVSNDTTYIF